MATSFGHIGHHQAISQKLTKAGTHSATPSISDMIPFAFILMYLLPASKLLPALKCAIYSTACRGSVVDAVSTFNSEGR
jgi:hypothetical protein